MKEALFYEKAAGNKVHCGLCRFRCIIADGRRGICNVRENRGGILYSLVYGKIIAENIDPVEKKPLFHFMPGSATFSVATAGCNFHCLQCQNYTIAQVDSHAEVQGSSRSLEQIVKGAVDSGCNSISYTYTEPTIFYEFAFDVARHAQEAGLKNIFVTNGYICKEPLLQIAPFLDAANIDLKGFDESKYPRIFGGKLSEVLDSIIEYKRLGIWLELTTLVIPEVNDSEEELRNIAAFIRDNLGAATPWHLSRFYPTHKMIDRPATPVATVMHAVEIGRQAGLHHVYAGNIPGNEGEETLCQNCQRVLIQRSGFRVNANRLANGHCPDCREAVAGVWQ
jgi:pyruvate formate lyase activating enzyme